MESAFGVESPAFVAIRAILSMCSIGLLGAVAFRWVVLPRYVGPDTAQVRSAISRRVPVWIDRLGVVAVVATIGRVVAQHAAVFGSDVELGRASLGRLLIQSHWGESWWLAFFAAVVVTWSAPRLQSTSGVAWFTVAVATLALVVAAPMAGHPAAAGVPWRSIGLQTVHVVAAGGWIGALAFLTFSAIPTAVRLDSTASTDEHIAALVRAFSPTALACSALVMSTGVITALMNIPDVDAIWRSAYGRTLVLKLGFLSVAVASGAFNWRRLLPSLGTARATRSIRRSSLLELAAATLVVVVSAALVATPMPGE